MKIRTKDGRFDILFSAIKEVISRKENLMAKFETQVELHNQYGECVCVLEDDGYGYYLIPVETCLQNLLFAVGDTYHVVEVEREVD